MLENVVTVHYWENIYSIGRLVRLIKKTKKPGVYENHDVVSPSEDYMAALTLFINDIQGVDIQLTVGGWTACISPPQEADHA